jgi:hypothetical protein
MLKTPAGSLFFFEKKDSGTWSPPKIQGVPRAISLQNYMPFAGAEIFACEHAFMMRADFCGGHLLICGAEF